MKSKELTLRGLILGALIAIMFMGCASTSHTASARRDGAQQTRAVPASPCEDPQYVELRGKTLDAMSPREYEYFKRKDTECGEFRLRHGPGQHPAFETTQWPRASEAGGDSIRVAANPVAHGVGRVVGIVTLATVAGFVGALILVASIF